MTTVAESLPHPPGFKPVTFSVGLGGEAFYAAVGEMDLDAPFGTDVRPGWAAFPRSRAGHPYRAAITVYDAHFLVPNEVPPIHGGSRDPGAGEQARRTRRRTGAAPPR